MSEWYCFLVLMCKPVVAQAVTQEQPFDSIVVLHFSLERALLLFFLLNLLLVLM
jgi:hypothetical protein